MEERQRQVQDLMNRYGYEEKEAEAAYHLRCAYKLFEELYWDESPPPEDETAEEAMDSAAQAFKENITSEVYHRYYFNELLDLLGLRVLARDYPEGWGRDT